MKWLLWFVAIAALMLVVSVAGVVGFIVYMGINGPDTKVLPGSQVPQRYIAQIKELGVIEPQERIKFFYSDALVDIEQGFYLFTDKKVVVYSKEFDEPAIVVPFSEIADMEVQYDDSFWSDSMILLTLQNGEEVWFPVSSEGGGDRRFFESLREAWQAKVTPEAL